MSTTAQKREARFRSKAPWIMELLQHDFGIDLMSSAAILGNLGHECAGFTLFQEGKPLVPGSKGGYGWAQWTGPRRKAFEAYCRRNRLATDSDKANYGWLFVELGTTERGAIPAVKKARGLNAKVEAFERNFERASEDHKGYPSRQQYAKWALDEYGKATADEKTPPFLIAAPAMPKVEDGPQLQTLLLDDPEDTATAATPGIVPGRPVAAPEVATVSADAVIKAKPPAGILGKLASFVTGNPTGIAAKTQLATDKARPGLAPDGDPALYDIQGRFVDLGYTEVGDPDGLTGRKTRTAISLFREDQGMAPGSVLDDDVLAALAKATPLLPNAKRANLQAQDLRQAGNKPVEAMDKVRRFNLTTLLPFLGLGGLDAAGTLDAAKQALATGNDVLDQGGSILAQIQGGIASVISIVQWCVHHWWIFGLVAVFFILKWILKGTLEMVILARQSKLFQFGSKD